jgi:hypothetical protein
VDVNDAGREIKHAIRKKVVLPSFIIAFLSGKIFSSEFFACNAGIILLNAITKNRNVQKTIRFPLRPADRIRCNRMSLAPSPSIQV